MADIPLAVQRQIDAAAELEKQMFGTDTGEDAPPPDDVEPPNAEGTEAGQDPGTPDPDTPTGEEDNTPPPTAKPGREDDPAYWRDRAYALYGVNQQMLARIQTLEAAQKGAPSEPAKPEKPLGNERDAEAFGTDMVSMVERRAAEIAKAMLAQKEAEFTKVINALQNNLGAVNTGVAQTKEDLFYAAMDRAVPDWQTVNEDPAFLRWLGEPDGISGVSRQAVLAVAENQLDAARAAAVFKAFMAGRAAPAKDAVKPDKTKELQRQVSPATTGAQSGGEAKPGNAKMWTLAEYSHAVNPQNWHRYGKPQAQQMAADAEKALLEGRVSLVPG